MIPAIAAPAFSSGPRERSQENAVNPAPESEASGGLLGGFRKVEKDNPHVIESVRFLNAEMYARGIRVQEVRSSEIQIVSGYKVHLVADYQENGTSDVLDALIYLPPRGEPQLLSLTYGAE